ASTTPKPFHWTIRFKCHNITVLLSVAPTQTFTSLKESLLSALKARGVNDINGKAVPSNPDEVELGVPLDKNNLQKGWELLETPSGNTKSNALNASPLAADMKDGQPLAFRFRSTAAEDATTSADKALDLALAEDPGWDVLVPSFEDEEEE
ncbi:hypothetical protein KEM55_007345, partial [Ascosphaera atra]